MADPVTQLGISSVNDVLREAASVQLPEIALPSQSSVGPTSNGNSAKSSVWLGVHVLSKNKSNYHLQCLFCQHQFHGSAGRARLHFVGKHSSGVKKCTELDSVPENLLTTLKAEEVQRERDHLDRERRRKLSSLYSQQLLPQLQGTTDVRKSVARFFLAEGIPFSKVESHFFLQMAEALKKGGGVPLPNRRTLSTTLTAQVYNEVANEVANSTIERGPATLVADGWKTCSGDPVMAYLQCWVDFNVYRASFNTSGERRTGQVIAEQAHSVVTCIGCKNICHFVTDSGSDCKAARGLLPQMEGTNHILGAACACHCMDLLLEDLFKQIPSVKTAKDRGDAIVNYIRNHNLLSGEFKRLSGVELLSPAETRFGTTVIELDRLNDFKTDVNLTFHGEKADLQYRSLGKATEKEKFRLVKSYVNDEETWEMLTYALQLTIPVLHIIRFCDNSGHEAGAFFYAVNLSLQEYYRTSNYIKADDRHSILTFHHARWDMAHTILHDVGFLLNPLNLVNEPWAVVSVMEGFRELIKLWNEFIARDGDSPEKTIAKATNELEIYIDVAKNSAKAFVSKIRRPDTIAAIAGVQLQKRGRCQSRADLRSHPGTRKQTK
ncbi:hypothetical protein ACHWQZ_G002972 [Mnemiopsis leidyi]